MESAKEWFKRFHDLGKTPVFTLRFNLRKPSGALESVTIRAYEGPIQQPHGHTTLFCQLAIKPVKHGAPLFPRERFYVGVPAGETIDGDYARELVMSLFSMKPGDSDDDFFADYTPEQRAFVEQFGDDIKLEAHNRYGEF